MLKITDLKKRFGTIQAVDSVSLEVAAGEIYGLLGPNGAGKTTIISIVSGLLKRDSGEVSIGGELLESVPQRVRQIMSLVPQELAIYQELTARENFVYWGRLAGLSSGAAKQRALELLDRLSLTDRADEQVRRYSGGMKRRVNLGCAMMSEPKLLLLDEPTVGVDPQARENILDFIRGLCKNGTAVLYTTHHLEEAEKLCDRIGVIDKGKILAQGTLDELQKLIGEQNVFVVEADFTNLSVDSLSGFGDDFRLIRKDNHQILVGLAKEREPAKCFRRLLELPVRVENVIMKRPSLNDVFFHLTGRELREKA